MQHWGRSAQTAPQQSASEQYGPVCGEKQLRCVPSGFSSPQSATFVVQSGFRKKGVSLVAVIAFGPWTSVFALRQR